MNPQNLQKYAWLSICAAILTILLKGLAWWITGSVGLLSDALESFVNLAGALMALWMLWLAEQPADDEHPHGHTKAEYFSSAFEGMLIIIAAMCIIYAAVLRLRAPMPLEKIDMGSLLSLIATGINFMVARVLIHAGQTHQSIVLTADAHHLLTDVWTSVGVIIGVSLAYWSGYAWVDPLIALAVAANIIWTGWKLVSRSANGLMDVALPEATIADIKTILDRYNIHQITYHALRTRQAGQRSFVSMHILVPPQWSVQTAHDWAERIEAELRAAVRYCHVITHIEPNDDPHALNDTDLDRLP